MNVFELFKESFGVGVVASKKQAKDPRYSHSLTVDVKPDTPKKNQRALGLTEATAKEKEAWLAIVQPYAEHAAKMLGINPRFILRQWALESGYKIPKNNNLGGITKSGEDSGFREYDSLEEYTQDWLVQIERNWPAVKDAKTMDEYVDALQNKGRLGAYAREEGDLTYGERLAGVDTGYVPGEEPTTVATSPEADDSGNEEEEDRLSLIKRIADQRNKITGVDTDPNARDWMDLLYALYPDTPEGRNQARQDIRTYLSNAEKDASKADTGSDASEFDKNRQDAIDAEFGGTDVVSGTTKQPKAKKKPTTQKTEKTLAELEAEYDALAQAGADTATLSALAKQIDAKRKQAEKKKEVEIEPVTITVNAANTKETIDDLRRQSEDYSLTDEERAEAKAEIRRRREELQKRMDELRKDPDKNQMELNRLAGIYNANFGSSSWDSSTIKDKGEEGYRKRKEVAKDEIKSPADLDLLAADIEQQAKDAEKRGDAVRAAEIRAKAEKVKDQAEEARRQGIQYVDLGQEQDGTIEDQVDLALDKMRKAEPDTVTDSGFKVSPESERAELDRKTADADREEREEKADMSKVGTADPDDPFFKYGDAETPPKVDTKPKPEKVEPEEIEFQPTKQRQHYKDKYGALTPAFMMDEPDKQAVYARERVKREAAKLMRSNPAEYNRKYGGNKLEAAIKAAEDEAYAKFDEPQKKAPIVDKSIDKDKEQPEVQTKPEEKTNANVPSADTSDAQSSIGKSVSGMQVAKAKDEEEKAKREAEKAKKQAEQESERAKAQGQTDASLAGEKAKREQEQRQKEQEEKREAQEAERKSKEEERKAKEELKKAEQEAKKAEQEAMRKAADANRKRFQTRGAPMPVTSESAIFRAIMRK